MAAVHVGCVFEVLIGCIYYAGEAFYVHIESLHVAGVVQLGVPPAAAGGIEQVVHAVDKLDELVEALYGVVSGESIVIYSTLSG